MQKITIAGQINLPRDEEAKEDAIDRVRAALSELSGLIVTQTRRSDEAVKWASFAPFQDIRLSDDGELSMSVIERQIDAETEKLNKVADKTEILASAEADDFRGRYLAFGAIHYWSLGAGMVGGALVMAVFVEFIIGCK